MAGLEVSKESCGNCLGTGRSVASWGLCQLGRALSSKRECAGCMCSLRIVCIFQACVVTYRRESGVATGAGLRCLDRWSRTVWPRCTVCVLWIIALPIPLKIFHVSSPLVKFISMHHILQNACPFPSKCFIRIIWGNSSYSYIANFLLNAFLFSSCPSLSHWGGPGATLQQTACCTQPQAGCDN